MTQIKDAVKVCECAHCGEKLNSEELEFPYVHEEEDGPICENCDNEHYRDYCEMCGEIGEKSELIASPGKLIAIFQAVPALAHNDLEPGFYRIKKWPFFADGMIEGCFYSDAVERAGDLDDRALLVAKQASYQSCPLCDSCQTHAEKIIVAQSVIGIAS